MTEKSIKLVGAAHDYICPEEGQEYIFFQYEKYNKGKEQP